MMLYMQSLMKKLSLIIARPLVKHALLIKPDKAGSSYNEDTWTDVVKKKLPKQLPNIPVSKAALTKKRPRLFVFSG